MTNATDTKWTKVAAGLFASNPTDMEGPVRVVSGLQEILALMREPNAGSSIIVTNVAGGSAVSTIIRRASAIVSTIGGPNSHIVVVARDYNVPCIVGAAELDIAALSNGVRMRLHRDGTLEIQDSPAKQPLSMTELQVLRTISFAGALEKATDAIGFEGQDVEAIIAALAKAGMVTTDDIITLSPAGNEALEAWYAADRVQLDEKARASLLKQFRPLDREIKRVATLWQNAQAKDDWDGRVRSIEALGALHTRTLEFLADYAKRLPRLEEYTTRLGRAHKNVNDGKVESFVGMRSDSYHTAWFHLHEDLLRLLQRERDPE